MPPQILIVTRKLVLKCILVALIKKKNVLNIYFITFPYKYNYSYRTI